MNSGVLNCIEVRKFWEYLTDLRTNIEKAGHQNAFLVYLLLIADNFLS